MSQEPGVEMYRYQNFNRYRHLKIDLNWYRYLPIPIPIPRIPTDIYQYRYFFHWNIKDFNQYLKIDLNRYWYLPIQIPKISTDIYRYQYFGTSLAWCSLFLSASEFPIPACYRRKMNQNENLFKYTNTFWKRHNLPHPYKNKRLS